jgi:hypothetical protein
MESAVGHGHGLVKHSGTHSSLFVVNLDAQTMQIMLAKFTAIVDLDRARKQSGMLSEQLPY